MRLILVSLICFFSGATFARDCQPQVIEGPCHSSGKAEVKIVACDGQITQTTISCTPAEVYRCYDYCTEDRHSYGVRLYIGYDQQQSSYSDYPSFRDTESCRQALAADSRCP